MTPEQQALVTANLLLAYHLAGKAYRRACAMGESEGTTLDDLCQESVIGLCRAAKGFKPDKKVRFCTYATYVIRNHLKDALSASHIIAHPRGIAQKKKYAAHIARTKKVEDNPYLERAALDPLPVDDAGVNEGIERLERLLTKLGKSHPRELQVIRMRLTGMSYEQIGKVLGYTRQAAHSAGQRAMARLRQWAEYARK